MTTRKARQARSRLLANKIILVALVVVVLAALYGLAKVTRPVTVTSAAGAAQGGRLTVTSALVGCPAPGSAGVIGGAIAIANAPAAAGTGQMVMTRLDPATTGTDVGVTPRLGELTIERIKAAPALPKHSAGAIVMANGLVRTQPARGGLLISAAGANAQGLDVEQLGPGRQPTARCQPAGSDFWFVGPGAPSLHLSLYLMNSDSQPADAAVSVQTDSGPWLGPEDSGIVVPQHSMIVQTLDKLVHGAKAIALHVTTSAGRVVAAVRATTSTAKAGAWLPVAAEPATTQILAGLPTIPGQRVLYLTVPGNAPAQVKVTAISSRGSYQPTGGSIPLLGHQTTAVAIPSLGGTSGAIEITSNVPVTGVLDVTPGPRGTPGAFIVGSGAIVGQGVLAANTAGTVGSSELVLAAPDGAASVTVSEAIPGEPLTGLNGRVVHVAGKSAALLRLTAPRRSKATLVAVVVTPLPGSGPVYAGRIAVIRGTVQTIQSVVSSPARVQLGPVHESLLSVLGSTRD